MQADYSFYLVMDDSLCEPRKMAAMVNSLCHCGITCVQLRMKKSPPDLIAITGKELLSVLKPRNIPLLINDHVEIADAIDADGVHIGQHDAPYHQVRQFLGNNKIIGLSIENLMQAALCQSLSVDYYGAGPIYSSTTKTDAATPIGILQLQRITQLLDKPVVAIGGIQHENLMAALNAGAAGIAVISAVLCAHDPVSAATQLNELIKSRKS